MTLELGSGPDIEAIRTTVAEMLELDPAAIGPDDDLIRLGIDSISMMRVASLWRAGGIEVKFGELVERPTLRAWHELAEGRRRSPGPAPPAVTVSEHEPFALATLQLAYWIGRDPAQALGVGAHFYAELDGRDVDPERLERAVRSLVARHGMLRARFLEDGTQQILETSPWERLEVHDLRALAPADAQARLEAIRAQLSHRRLDVEAGRGFDVQLSLLAGGATRVHIDVDMLVADAQSFRIVLGDLARLYERPGEPLRALDYSFARYLAERERGRVADRDHARTYWAARLDELPGPPQLPLAVEPDEVRNPRATRRYRWLPGAIRDRLAARAAEHGVTLSMAFLTAYAEVLAAWSASPRFLLNLPFYDREPLHPDVPELVGDFTNVILLDVDASATASFAERALALQRQLHRDARHTEFSGVEVLRELARARPGESVGAPVVFTSALSLGELFDDDLRDCLGSPVWTMSQTPQVWLDNQVTEREGGLFVNWDAVDELFGADTLDAMFDAYARLLQWLAEPGSDWSAPVPELVPDAQLAVRERVNATDGPVPGGGLHEAFFRLAREQPQRPALLWGAAAECSYGELRGRALRLAALLVECGVRDAEPVVLTLPKGPEQIVAVLAIHAAGGAYVPIDVDQPPARVARIVANAGARVAICEDAALLPAGVQAVSAASARDLAPLGDPRPAGADDLAYILYTSGSTGEPKGVMISHRAALNTIEAINDRWGVGPDDRALAVSGLDFDLSVYDIFGPLGRGGALVLPDQDARRDAERWVELVRTHGASIVNCVPALLDMLLESAGGDGLPSLRLVLLGGDWVGLDLPGRLAAASPGCRFVALGGTTETAIHSTYCEVESVPAHWRSVPYGVPLRNVCCRVADGAGRDRPDWVAGELWIGGASVAEGYRGDPERSARQFVTHRGRRWYRTGDMARYWPDGTLEFLGRRDHQIKIRGHRIELGEVESAVEAHPAIARAVALVVRAGGRPQLAVAYTAASPPPATELRAFVAERLPHYMVPEQQLALASMPLTGNGKIDRRSLAAQLAAAEPEPGRREAPRGPIERAVAAAWSELLGVPDVAREDGFFALGGDSLTATRLMTRLRAAGIGGARLRDLFAAPELRAFAAGLTLAEVAPRPAAPLRADPEHRHEPFAATDVQRAYWLGRSSDFTLGGVGSHWYWEFDGEGVDLERLEEALNRLVARHEMLRAVFDDDGRQRILPAVEPLRVTVWEAPRDAPGPALERLREEMAHEVLDPGRWPLLDVRAVRYGERVRVGFAFDYIVLDALSIMIVFDELGRLYADPAAELAPIGVSFRDYVLGELEGSESAPAQAYWRARLEHLPPAPQLPLRTDPASVRRPRFRRRAARLDAACWEALVQRARARNLTPSTVLAAAYAEVLSAWSGRRDLTLNFTLFDRREVHPDIYGVLGDFTSLLLVRHAPEAGESWAATAARLQDDVWDGMGHREVSAVWVIRELARLRRTPDVAMPVVFTSALGVAPGGFDLSTPFGELVWGLSQTPQVWLDCQVMERRGELLFNWDAVEELFPEGLLDDMFAAYERLLRSLASPDCDWSQPLRELMPAAQRATRERVNATGGPLPERTLHERFFDRARTRPDGPAVLWRDGRLTHGELRERALALAGALLERGLAPGEPVVVSLAKGPEQVVAVLGVLAAGGVYVPVGSDQPPARRARIATAAGARVAVARAGAEPAGMEVVALAPEGAGALAGRAVPRAAPREPLHVDPDALAYIIYTSGSTGEPKGVMVTHRAALNTIDAVNDRCDVGERDRVLAVSALDFDLSVYDIFGLLDRGGALVIPEEQARREAAQWLDLAHRHEVTIWNSVPALLEMLLVVAEDRGLPSSLRVALVSGDWIGLDLPERLAALRPGTRFVAMGGATEAAIWSNALEVERVDPSWRSIPYGYPLRNQRFRVVDDRGRECPDWVPGELWIGGAGVAQGYRADAERTASQFPTVDGERWYRTGDVGRYWPSGALEFLGRRDQQVKVRGHRIELGEVESALEAHPGVSRAVALVTGEAPQLVAVVSERGSLDGDELRRFVAERVPTYMVPVRIVVAAELPLTANGKLDRRAAAGLAGDAAAPCGVREPPEGPIETAVAAAWVSLLTVDEVARDDDFFALGGDSLLATRLVEALRRRFGVELSLRRLFASPTVAGLASAIGEARTAPTDDLIEEGVL